MSQLKSDHFLVPGARVRLRCDDADCFVGDIEVTSKGGAPRHAPSCPGCQTVMRPQGEVLPPIDVGC